MGAVPTHEQLKTNPETTGFNGNTMEHLNNYIDGHCSGHHILRQVFIAILTNESPANPKNFQMDLSNLNDELLAELKQMLQQLEISFEWSWNRKDLKYKDESNNYECTKETAQKWDIERNYIFHWLKKVQQKTFVASGDCVVQTCSQDVVFVTDGERIASLYQKNHYLHKK